MKALTFLWCHRTKVLAVLQIIASQLATAGVLADTSVKWVMLVSGILTGIVGFINSAQTKEPPSA